MFPWFLALLLNYSAVAASTIVIKVISVISHPPLMTMGIRNALGGLLFIFICSFIKKKKVSLLKEAPGYVVKSSLFRIFLPAVFAYWAIQYMSTAKFVFFYNFCPFITYILSYFLLNEVFSFRKLTGVIVGFCGIIPILIATKLQSEQALQTFLVVSLPEIAMLLSMISLTYSAVDMRRLVIKRPDISVYAITAYDSFFGGILAIIFAACTSSTYVVTSVPAFIGCMVTMTFLISIITNPTYAYLLKHFSATFLSIGGLSVPFFTAFFAWVLLDETIGWELYASTGFVLMGSVIFYYEEKRSEKMQILASQGQNLPL